jgi:hypothetical protein
VPKITREEIERAKTPGGAWTKKQLAEWGVPWPPPKGWKAKLLKGQPAPPDKPVVQRTKFPFAAKINGTEVTVWPDWIEWPE